MRSERYAPIVRHCIFRLRWIFILINKGKDTKKSVQKLCKMYTKIIQSTKFVYILYTEIAQIKLFYDNECTKNVHQIATYIQKMYKLYKICKKFRLKTARNWKCMFSVHKNNLQTI